MHLFKKILKILSFIIIGVVLLILVVNIFIDPIVKNYLENQINKADEGQYSARIDHVDISLLRGNFIVNGISLQTDTASARENKTPIINLKASEISVKGVSWLRYLFSNKLQLDRISFLDLNAQAKVRTTDTADTTKPFKWEHLDIYPLIKEQVDRVRLNDLRFSNINFTLINIESNDSLIFNAEEFNLKSDDILIAADMVFSDARAFYASKIDIQGKDVKINRVGRDQWRTELTLIEVDTRESDLGIHSEKVFFLKEGSNINDTVFFASFAEFKLNDLNMNRVQEDSVAKLSNVVLNEMIVINNFDVKKEDVEEADKRNIGFDVTEFTLGDNLPELLDRIIIDKIVLENINYKEQEHLVVEKFNFTANEIIVDNKPAFADNRFLHAKQFEVSIEKTSYLERKRLIQVGINNFIIDIEGGLGNLQIERLSANHLENNPGELYAEAALDGFAIIGLDTRDFEEKKFSIDSIALQNPELFIDLGGGNKNTEQNSKTSALDLYPAIKDVFKEVHINKIALIEGDFSITGMQGNKNVALFPAVYVQLSNVFIAEGTAFAGGRILHADDIAVRMERIFYPFPDNVHHINLNLLRMSTREKFLKAYGLSYDYNRNFKKILEGAESNQVFSLSNDLFLINNLDYESLAMKRGFFTGSIKVEGLNVEVFKDNHFPAEESEEESYPTPQQMIKDIELPIYLGELSLKNARILFEELAEGGEVPGKFTIEDLNLNIKNLTNVDNIINDRPEITISVNGLLMGDGYFETKMVIPMHDDTQQVKIAGKVDTLDLTELNRYTEFTTRFGIESGTIYKILWDFEAGKEQAVGKFGLSYEDLNVQLSEEDTPAPAGTLYQIGAYLANALVLDSDIAEAKSNPPKTAEFEREKDEEESFIEHYIASLMAGFIEIMGFPLSIIDP